MSRLETLRHKVVVGGVHHIDVLGEEHDFSDVLGQLRRVICGEQSFSLTNFSHQGKHVVAGFLRLGLFNLRVRHQSDQVIVDVAGGRSTSR